jgi:thiosulfate dehydrogenase [quinone] large subunit
MEEPDQTEKLVAKYNLQVPKEIASSVLMRQPKVPVLLSRASFRPDVDVRMERRTQFQQGRRQFLRGIMGIVGISVIGLFLLKTLSVSSPQVVSASNAQPVTPTSRSSGTANSGQLLVNASNIPPNRSLVFNDPAAGPIVLIHLDNGQFVAYSTICTHAGCQVQFDPQSKDLVCPCHGAVYDPYNKAQVLAGPAPYPLQSIPIQYDSSTGNIYLTG